MPFSTVAALFCIPASTACGFQHFHVLTNTYCFLFSRYLRINGQVAAYLVALPGNLVKSLLFANPMKTWMKGVPVWYRQSILEPEGSSRIIGKAGPKAPRGGGGQGRLGLLPTGRGSRASSTGRPGRPNPPWTARVGRLLLPLLALARAGVILGLVGATPVTCWYLPPARLPAGPAFTSLSCVGGADSGR